MAAARRFGLGDDFGILSRGDDLALCAGGPLNHPEKCRVVDDAVLYLRSSNEAEIAAVLAAASQSSPNFPNTPPGQLPLFYRAVVTLRLFAQKAGRPGTLKEVLTVLDLVEDTRGRDDDYAMLDTATRAVLGYKLDPAEQAWVEERKGAVLNAGKETTGGGVGAALVLGAGGFAVGGPVGAGVGFVVGLLAARK